MNRKKRSYRDNLHPAFYEVAEVNKTCELKWKQIQEETARALKSLGKSAPSELQTEGIRRRDDEAQKLLTSQYKAFCEINQRYKEGIPIHPLAYSYFSQNALKDENAGIAEYAHWERHGESLQRTQNDAAGGSLAALKRLHRTDEDLFVVSKRESIKRFQGDETHRQLLELMLCYEVKEMTGEQRAECADDYCACGKVHDADALGKQFRRLKKQLTSAAESAKPRNLPPRGKRTKRHPQ
jgi:hypothetical protein